jgi:hypothetical protein
VAVYENIIKARGELTSDEHRVLLANKIAELGGGPTIMEYLHFLRDLGLEIEQQLPMLLRYPQCPVERNR